MTEPLIALRGVTKAFGKGVLGRGRTVALENISLAIDTARPSIIAVVGESGSGKTTLARLLLGFTSPSDGEVLYRGRSLARLDAAGRRAFRTDVQAIFQDPYGVFNPFYRVDHVLRTPVAKFRLARGRAEARALIEDALRAVGLRADEILGRFPHQLSGGQRQRVMVARALLLKPKLIVADEPVSMVDASLRATILGSLRRLTDERGISILYITHDLATAYQVSDSIIVLYRAMAAEAGEIEAVVKRPLHPYTQLLIRSIPRVSTERDWVSEPVGGGGVADGGCRFAARCPAVMDVCRERVPPLYRADARQVAACFLYRDRQVVPAEALGGVVSAASDGVVEGEEKVLRRSEQMHADARR
jgi:oligopeptide/dipeptide ABC transporter ATP-binding protein